MSDDYANIRDILGPLIGLRLVDITQHDQEEWDTARISYVCLMFEDGSYIKFPGVDPPTPAFQLGGPAAEVAPDDDDDDGEGEEPA